MPARLVTLLIVANEWHSHSDGGGDGGRYPDVKLEYRNDGTRHKVAVDAEESPDFRYQVV